MFVSVSLVPSDSYAERAKRGRKGSKVAYPLWSALGRFSPLYSSYLKSLAFFVNLREAHLTFQFSVFSFQFVKRQCLLTITHYSLLIKHIGLPKFSVALCVCYIVDYFLK